MRASLTLSNNLLTDKAILVDYLYHRENEPAMDLMQTDGTWYKVKISGEDNEDSLHDFLLAFIEKVQKKAWSNQLVYAEREPSRRSRARSKIGLFYDWRKNGIVDPDQLFEVETPVPGGRLSYHVGFVQLNDDAGVEKLEAILDHAFDFGLIVPSETATEKIPLTELLDLLRNEVYHFDGTFVQVNHYRLITTLVARGAIAYHKYFDGQDNATFVVYSPAEWSDRMENTIKAVANAEFLIDHIIVNPHEPRVQEIIEEFLADK